MFRCHLVAEYNDKSQVNHSQAPSRAHFILKCASNLKLMHHLKLQILVKLVQRSTLMPSQASVQLIGSMQA